MFCVSVLLTHFHHSDITVSPQICSYVNGILYSLLTLPELREEAQALVRVWWKVEGGREREGGREH